MKLGLRAVALTAALLLGSATLAFGHRLDEYLQASTFTVERDQVTLRLRLAPGVAVAAQVIALIDEDRNGTFSAEEERRYVQRLVGDLSLSVDGQKRSLVPTSAAFGTPADMRAGTGEIVVELRATLPAGAGPSVLSFENHHLPKIAVYLVNTLLPRDTNLHVVSQSRSYNQARYALRFTVGTAGTASAAASVASADRWAVIRTYFVHGIEHILTGYDHLLFACALVLAATSLWDLVKVVTAFTIAHSITLTLATLGVAHVSERLVEPLIAASIVFVAVQNVFWPARAHGWSRIAVAFGFGLFHGLAFAGGLLDLMRGMQGGTVILAILGFSIGVEAGHQIVLLPLFAGLRVARRAQPDVRRSRVALAIQRVGSGGIALAGAYYLAVALTAGR